MNTGIAEKLVSINKKKRRKNNRLQTGLKYKSKTALVVFVDEKLTDHFVASGRRVAIKEFLKTVPSGCRQELCDGCVL